VRRLLRKIRNKFIGQKKLKNQYLNVRGYNLEFPGDYPTSYILEEKFREQLLSSLASHAFSEEKNAFIDAGANVGITTAIIKSASNFDTDGILIEPSEKYISYLKRNILLFGRSTIITKYISPNFPIIDLESELFHWGGTAHLVSSANSKINISEQIDLLEFVSVKTALIKLDCDYSDLAILSNLIPRLGNNLPFILFECVIRNDEDLNSIFKIFESMYEKGYSHVVLTHNEGFLIYSGDISINLYLILNFQLNLRKHASEDKFYYSDVLLIPKGGETIMKEVTNELVVWQNIRLS
jgi:FkbM family methyltransferase